ncbi:MAG: lipocalin family protein, partial [Thermodesulfobacteriota bacterium]
VGDFTIEPLDKWRSPTTGTVYPSQWQISIPRYSIAITVVPYLNGQELPLTFVYWEGAVKFKGGNVSGNGYVELTGYASPAESDGVSNSPAGTR